MGVSRTRRRRRHHGVIVAGAFLGVINTLMTQTVMESAPVERPVASAAYSFVRFCGGARRAVRRRQARRGRRRAAAVPRREPSSSSRRPPPLLLGRSLVRHVDADEAAADAAPAIAPARVEAPAPLLAGGRRLKSAAEAVTAEAARSRPRLRGRPVHVSARAGGRRSSATTPSSARAPRDGRGRPGGRLAQLQQAGVPAGGEVLHTFGDHEDTVQAVLDRVDAVGAQVVVVGRRGRVAERARVPVVVVPSGQARGAQLRRSR